MKLTLMLSLPGSKPYVATLSPEKRWAMFEGPKGSIAGAHLVQFQDFDDRGDFFALVISNAACLPDGSGFCGRLYFDRLTLSVDPACLVVHELNRPCVNGWDLVKPLPSGQHVLDAGRALVFRIGIAAMSGDPFHVKAALSLNPLEIPRIVHDYGPQRMKLPQVNRKAQAVKWAAKLERQRKCLEGGYADSGSYFWGPALGPYHLPEETLAGAYGGRRIQMTFGYGQVREEVLYERRLMDRFIERMVVHCFDKRTGERITSEDWAAGYGKPWQPFQTEVISGDEEARDPYAPNKAPTYPPALDPDRKFNEGTCPYEAQLRQYDTIDAAHLCRAMGSAWAAWWHAKDPLARMYLANLGHHVRQAWLDDAPPPQPYSRSMRVDLEQARAKPGQGRPSLARGKGWMMACLASAHAVARNAAERGVFDAAMRMALEVHALAAMPSGLSQRQSIGGIQEAWDIGALKPEEDGCQSFEFGILGFGVLCCLWQLELVPLEKPPQPAPGSRPVVYQRNLSILMRGCRDYLAQGIPPKKYRVVAMKNGAPLMSSKPAGEKYDFAHVRELLAGLWRASGHPDMERLCRTAAGTKWPTILDTGSELDYPEWFPSLVAMMQEAG